MEKFRLHPHWQRHLGHCQVTYLTKNKLGQSIVYCLQKHSGIRLLRCTQDGEPSHEVKPHALLEFERPPSEDKFTEEVNLWIDEHEAFYRDKKD